MIVGDLISYAGPLATLRLAEKGEKNMPEGIASTSIGAKYTEFTPNCRVVLQTEKGFVVLRLLDARGEPIDLNERLRPLLGCKIDIKLEAKVVGRVSA